VVDEYVSDDFASGSEDDKQLRRARETVGRKRRQALLVESADKLFSTEAITQNVLGAPYTVQINTG